MLSQRLLLSVFGALLSASANACEGECIIGITNAFLGNYSVPVHAALTTMVIHGSSVNFRELKLRLRLPNYLCRSCHRPNNLRILSRLFNQFSILIRMTLTTLLRTRSFPLTSTENVSASLVMARILLDVPTPIVPLFVARLAVLYTSTPLCALFPTMRRRSFSRILCCLAHRRSKRSKAWSVMHKSKNASTIRTTICLGYLDSSLMLFCQIQLSERALQVVLALCTQGIQFATSNVYP